MKERAMIETLAGNLLIALPVLDDPRFKRSVVLMCAHNDEHAMGIVINRIVDELTLSDVLDQFGEDADRVADAPVLLGGPVGRDRGFVLHSEDFDSPGGTLQVMDGVCLTTSKDILTALASDDPPERAVLALGYAGWGPHQLEHEIADNAWLVAPADPDIVFDQEFETKWSRALAKIGISPDKLQADTGTA